jgi:cell division GTPase FtsZ
MATADQIFEEMMGAGKKAFGESWDAVANYAPAEFRKMAIQITEIAQNGKLLMKMQRTAAESVLVATTQLNLIAVQKAMDAIYRVLRKSFKGVVKSIL